MSLVGVVKLRSPKYAGMAERQGFEPWEPVKVQRFSRPPHSTTLPPLRDDHQFNITGLYAVLISFCQNVLTTEKIEDISLNELRRRVRQNRVSFPSQVPTFPKHDRPDVQRKAVQLYFLFGWSCSRIAQRHGLLRQRVQQILSTWKRRAIQMGYIQEIPPDTPPISKTK